MSTTPTYIDSAESAGRLRLEGRFDLARAMCERLLQRNPGEGKALHQSALLSHHRATTPGRLN